MGLFDSLFGAGKPRSVDVVADHLWLTTDAKFSGIDSELAERATSESVVILLVAHFPDVLVRLKEMATQPSTVPVTAVLADSLSTEISEGLNLDETSVVDIIVGERHPLSNVDNKLMQFADAFPCRCRLSHHLSLDDTVIAGFGGDFVRRVLEVLHVEDDESICSPVVSRRVQQAQQKIAAAAIGNSPAESSGQWLKLNCPQLVSK
jgi:preprotein translocase subunit SecA